MVFFSTILYFNWLRKFDEHGWIKEVGRPDLLTGLNTLWLLWGLGSFSLAVKLDMHCHSHGLVSKNALYWFVLSEMLNMYYLTCWICILFCTHIEQIPLASVRHPSTTSHEAMLFKCKVCAWKHSKTSRHLAVENGDVTADSYSPKENLLTATVQWRARRLISSHLQQQRRGHGERAS